MTLAEPNYHDLVDRIRALTVERRFSVLVSDDTDAWTEGAYGYSPNNEHNARAVAGLSEADRLMEDLIGAGDAAVPAVVRGLRMQGRWRLRLFSFAGLHRGHPDILAALSLVSRRRRDPCQFEAMGLLEGV
jgi:hypothetical protein